MAKTVVFNPYVKELSLQLVKRAAAAGIPIKITETVRTWERQQELYNKGRVAPYLSESIVTNAKPGESYHNWGLAFDFCIDIPGHTWDTAYFKKVGPIGEALGLEWGGSWKGFVDLPHFQYTYGLSISKLQSGASIPERPGGIQYNAIEPPKTASDFVVNKEYDLGGVDKTAVGTMSVKGDTYINVGDLFRAGIINLGFNKDKKLIVIDNVLAVIQQGFDVGGQTVSMRTIPASHQRYVSAPDIAGAGVFDLQQSETAAAITTK